MPALFEAYVTNLGKYNEGELVGEYLKFPTTPEEVQALLKRIGVDGVRYEEIFITDFNGDVLGLYDHLGEYENLDELNHLACLLSELDQNDLEKFEAVIDSGEHTSSVADLINLTQNLDCFEFYSDVHSDEELGRMYVLEFGGVEVPEHLIDYIDYEAYGRDVRINESGHFAPGGYVFDNGSRFIEHYPYVWGGYKPSTSFDCSGFVSYVYNQCGWDFGRLGAQALYNISARTNSPRPGDLVFFTGTYDTPGVSHVGIYVGDGWMLHCGDPIGYANLNTIYWQSHFYAYGRLS